MSTTVISGGHVFDLAGGLRQADILIEDGEIQSVASSVEIVDATDADVVDATGDIVIPGLVNAHTHSNQAIEKGLCDALPLDAWMVLASYGGAGARLSPRELYVSAMVGALEMVRTGTTSVIDCARSDLEWFDEGMDAIMQAYLDLGMRAGVAAQYSDLDFFSSIPLHLVDPDAGRMPRRRADPGDVLQGVEAFVHRWRDRSPLVEPMLGPSSLPRCSVELFEASVELARRREARLQTHLLSARSQVAVATDRYGGSTVEFLGRIGCLEPWASFAHAIWLDDHEIATFGETSAVAVHNPVSNLKLGAGIAPIPSMLEAGATLALGADGASSNDSQNMFETMKVAALLPRVTSPLDQWPRSRDALRMCWEGGAAALGRPIGRLAPGYRADVVILRGGGLLLGPADQVANQLVYSELGGSVRTVLVEGRVVVRDGLVVTVDAAAIHAEAEALVARIWETLPDRLARFEDVRPMLARLEAAVGEFPLAFARSCCL